jgi:hypothetical protein
VPWQTPRARSTAWPCRTRIAAGAPHPTSDHRPIVADLTTRPGIGELPSVDGRLRRHRRRRRTQRARVRGVPRYRRTRHPARGGAHERRRLRADGAGDRGA